MFNMNIPILLLRLVTGLLFFGHGTQKLFGWFGGNGLTGTGEFFENIGFKPGKFWALMAGLGEALGGLGLALGFLTPIAAAMIISVMIMAIIKVHWPKVWNQEHGFEYPFVNLTIALVIALIGPGAYSLDQALSIAYPMPATFLWALGIGILGVLIGLISPTLFGKSQKMREA